MTDITIPPEAVEAAKSAYTAEIYKTQATARDYHVAMEKALIAAINAWPGMEARPTFTPSRIILPLQQEPRDE